MKLVFRVVYRIQRWASWLRYRAYRRFTRAGLTFGITLFIAGVLGPDTDNNLAYQVFALCFFTLAMAVAYSWPLRGSFAVQRHLPRFGTVGRPMAYSLTVRNLSKRTQEGLVLFETLVDPRPAFPDWLAVQRAEEREVRSFRFTKRRRAKVNRFKLAELHEASVPPILAGQEAQTNVEITPLRRGILRFTGVALARTDPLGLCRSFRRLPLPQTTVILPKRYPLPPIALTGTMKYQDGGVAMASHVGQSEEFAALRDYRYGDPLRHIHWRSWAKFGKPVVKEFEDEFFVRHALILDTCCDRPHSEAFEEAVSVAASFACTLDTQESLLDLLFVGPQAHGLTGGRGLARPEQMLEMLASVRPCGDQPFSELENTVVEHAASASGCVCVLLAWDEPRREMVRKLRTLGLPVMVIVINEAGMDSPVTPDQGLENFHVLEAGSIEKGLANIK